jgi:23S rRNA (cytosine1962-C5)-methyltransferase
LVAIYSKSKETLPEHFARQVDNSYLWGSATVPHLVKENGLVFYVNWEAGQKTGFFLDQRENRALIKAYAEGKTVLNTFAYSGGFSVYALAGSAREVTSVDISEKAVRLCEQNVALNAHMGQHTPLTEDVMRWLKEHTELYDLVILDPPAFAKSLSAKHRAVQGYKRLNMAGMLRVRSGGLLATFSCSQVVDRELFQHTVVAAALEIGRPARILHQLTQGPDHPVNLFHPEGSYLKGLILQLD